MKIATVGTSGITELFISAAKKQGYCFAAACSRDPARARAFADRHGMPLSFSDLGEAANSDAFEAVYIASPNALHEAQCRLFLEHGKHVLCEKPMTTTLAAQEALFRLADEKGLVCAEAIMSIHTPAFLTLQKAVGQIGRIRTVNLVFCQLSSKYPAYLRGENPNIFNPALHTGCLMDIGVYNLYLAAALFGEPEEVFSQAVFLESGADAAGTAVLRYPGFLVNLVYSKVGQSYSPSEIVGDLGTVSIGSVSQLTGIDLITKEGRTNLVKPDLTRDEVMGGEARYFSDLALNGPSDEYLFSRSTALLVRKLADQIRLNNHFPF